ncbi:MAG TPA: PIG-L family deacetylase [Terriglobales bacterium]|nr:PIG-L family deacetylase [Terriglobales bacterium]
MRIMAPVELTGARRCALLFAVLFVCVFPLTAASPEFSNRPGDPLPQDAGVPGLRETLRELNTTARLMQTVAHPDDEDGGMLTLEARGRGTTVLLLTLNRGEGGQNKVGSNLFDVLGVLRTLELLGADQYYGVEQRFTRVADFGFSKKAEETFDKWGGHDVALGDMVRVIRTFRPDVLVSRFSGTERDGHGNHQAAGLLTKEAFRAAADPNRFPEQIAAGLLPWQAKKVYAGNVCGFFASNCAAENYTVKLNTGQPDDVIGSSPIQFAMQGLRHQLSQGAANWTVEPGDRFTYYKLIDSVSPPKLDAEGHEKDLFDGIDTTITGLAGRLGSEEATVPFLRPGLKEMQSSVDEATKLAEKGPQDAAVPLLKGLKATRVLIGQLQNAKLSPANARELLTNLRTKEEQFETAANLAVGLKCNAVVDSNPALPAEHAFMAVPGQSFTVTMTLENPGKKSLRITEIQTDVPKGWRTALVSPPITSLAAGAKASVQFRVNVAEDASYTRPYWHRDNPEVESINKIDQPSYAGLALPPPPVRTHVKYEVDGLESTMLGVVMARYRDPEAGELKRPVAVAPPLSVALDPTTQVIAVGQNKATTIKVAATSNLPGENQTVVRLELPKGWMAEPASQKLALTGGAEAREVEFRVSPENQREGRYQIKATLEYQGKRYGEGYSVVTRADLATFYYYQPAMQRVSIVNVKVPGDLRVGYVMGAGDEIPTVLQQVGLNVTLVPADKLASEDLNKYQTIVLGIRAYDTQPEVAKNNARLLEFVKNGGTLLVQYNTGVSDFNGGHFTPYPAQLSRARVSVEDAPVEILAPQASVFHVPNEITAKDFDGWVQERGLYFMDTWDEHFQPLLSCHDPGESAQKGGLLMTQYGQGTYIYSGYAFFRQLPAGVPGAVRLYVNLLTAGKSRSQ